MPFSQLGLSASLINVLNKVGFKEPTDIQKQAIPILLGERDLLGCAQTGTGKTAAFLLPLIEILQKKRGRARMSRALILEPTRELAAQVGDAFTSLVGESKLSYGLIVGGEGTGDQEKKLNRGVDVIIATPGRLIDLMSRGKLLLSDMQFLVIDEADRMLDMGFIPDIEKILSKLPSQRITALFSATMPPSIEKISQDFLKDPVKIHVSTRSSAAGTVTQWRVHLNVNKKTSSTHVSAEKRKVLREILKDQNIDQAVIFCNRKKEVDYLSSSLNNHKFNASPLHGDMPQSKRTQTLDQFRKGDIKILIASDVAARGLDIDDITHVINFDVPGNAEDYVHRIGRTGRASRKGVSYLLTTPQDQDYLENIETLIQKKIPLFEVVYSEKMQGIKKEGKKETKTEKKEIKKEENSSLSSPQKKNKSVFQKPKDQKKKENVCEVDQKVIGFGDVTPFFMQQGLPRSFIERLKQESLKEPRYGSVEEA